jgi:alanine transaminase
MFTGCSLNGSVWQFLHFRIVDLSVPTSEYLSEMVDTLLARVAVGHKLYIHCWGGRGRAGVVGGSLLSRMYPSATADDVLAHVRVFLLFMTFIDLFGIMYYFLLRLLL